MSGIYGAYLTPGVVHEELRKVFEENRWAISSGATVTVIDGTHWQIYDEPETYTIEDAGTELVVSGEKKEFDKLDPMQIKKAEEELENLRDDGKVAELTDIYEMRAKDSAFYDPLCARCEPACPVALPITKFIRDVKADEKYR
jgi:hypothetical protein